MTIEALAHWLPMLLIAWGWKANKLPSPARIFDHPDRAQAEEASKEITTDRAEIYRFFRRLQGGR